MQVSKNIKIISDKISYLAGTLSLDFSNNNESIYYSPKENITNPLGYDVNKKYIAGRIDHFSFHTDGRVHCKYKNRNRKKSLYHEIGKLPEGLVPRNSHPITPLIIDSLFTSNGKWPLTPSDDGNLELCPWEFLSQKEISLLIFLVHQNFNHIDLGRNEIFKKLVIHPSALRIPFVHEWEVLVCLSPQTVPEIFPESLPAFGLFCDRKRCDHFPRQIVVGPTPLAFEHLCYGRSIVLPTNQEK